MKKHKKWNLKCFIAIKFAFFKENKIFNFSLVSQMKTGKQISAARIQISSYVFSNNQRVAESFSGQVRFSKFRAGLLKYYTLNLISDLFKVARYGYMCK